MKGSIITMNTTKSFTLPAELSSIWNLIKIISFTKDVAICKVQNTETKIDYILKIYASHIFFKKKEGSSVQYNG